MRERQCLRSLATLLATVIGVSVRHREAKAWMTPGNSKEWTSSITSYAAHHGKTCVESGGDNKCNLCMLLLSISVHEDDGWG